MNKPLFGAAIWGCSVALFKKKNPSTISCYSHVVCSSCCRCVVLRILLEKENVWWCPDCKVPLCIPKCFKLYHTVLNIGNVFCADFFPLIFTFLDKFLYMLLQK